MITMNSESAVDQEVGWGRDFDLDPGYNVSDPDDHPVANMTMPNGDPPTVTLWGSEE